MGAILPSYSVGDFIDDFGCCSAPFFPGHLLTLQLTFSVILGMTQSHLISFLSSLNQPELNSVVCT